MYKSKNIDDDIFSLMKIFCFVTVLLILELKLSLEKFFKRKNGGKFVTCLCSVLCQCFLATIIVSFSPSIFAILRLFVSNIAEKVMDKF